MNGLSVEFAPLLPLAWLALLVAAGALLVALALVQRMRGSILRAAALAALALALLNPVVSREDREALKSVVAVIVDRSQSQQSDERAGQTDAARDELVARLARYPNFDVRVVESSTGADGFARLYTFMPA